MDTLTLDPKDLNDSQRYKLLISSIVPRPIAWVSTVNPNTKVPNLAPFSYFTGVCNNPMTLLFCPVVPGEKGSKKDTLRNIELNGEFVVNIASENLAKELNYSAAPLDSDKSEFDYIGLTPASSTKISAPRVKEVPISFECKLQRLITVSDNPGGGYVVFGEVVHIHYANGLFDDSYVITPEKLNAFGRVEGEWFCRNTDRFRMERQNTVKKQGIKD